jgi:GT2 family glycosyltransferase
MNDITNTYRVHDIDVSVILVNYNTRILTSNCLRSLFDQTKDIAIEVIVVDNHSTDGSPLEIKRIFPQVRLIENESNIGFGSANNIGVTYAKGKYLFFLNTDTLLLNNAVKFFFEFMESHSQERVGAIGCVLFDQDNHPTHSSGRFPDKWEPIKHQILGYLTKKHVHQQEELELKKYESDDEFVIVDYVTGADLFIKRSVFEEFNGFDTHFFMYFEESDLQERMCSGKYRNFIIKGPQIIHLQGSSNTKPGYMPSKRIMNDKSMFHYFKKRSRAISYLLFRIGYFGAKLPLLFDVRVAFHDRLNYMAFLLKN